MNEYHYGHKKLQCTIVVVAKRKVEADKVIEELGLKKQVKYSYRIKIFKDFS